MPDFKKKEQSYSLLQNDEANINNGSLHSSGICYQTALPNTLVKWVVCILSVSLVLNTMSGIAGFFVGKAIAKEHYKSNIEREFKILKEIKQ